MTSDRRIRHSRSDKENADDDASEARREAMSAGRASVASGDAWMVSRVVQHAGTGECVPCAEGSKRGETRRAASSSLIYCAHPSRHRGKRR